MNSWIATNFSTDYTKGGRFYIQEASQSSGHPRPAYAPGDEFSIQPNDSALALGRIVTVNGDTFDVLLNSSARFRFQPTPSNFPQGSFDSDAPYEDMIASPR